MVVPAKTLPSDSLVILIEVTGGFEPDVSQRNVKFSPTVTFSGPEKLTVGPAEREAKNEVTGKSPTHQTSNHQDLSSPKGSEETCNPKTLNTNLSASIAIPAVTLASYCGYATGGELLGLFRYY